MNAVDQALEALVERVVRQVVREELAATRSAPDTELVTMATFARERALSVSTVRAMISDGRLQALKIGRAVRVRRDAPIGRPMRAPGETSADADTPRARAERILRRLP